MNDNLENISIYWCFYPALPGKLKEFCRYNADLSYSGTQTFLVPVEFGAWSGFELVSFLGNLFVNADSGSNAPDKHI